MDEPSRRRWTVSIRGLRGDLGLDRARLAGTLRATLEAERAPDGEVSLALVGDRTMRRISRDYRGIDRATDVLSFSYVDEPHAGGLLGEIFVSPAVARRQARDAGCTVAEEIARLAVHGLLHVLGHDHDTPETRRSMLRRQARYVKKYAEPAAC